MIAFISKSDRYTGDEFLADLGSLVVVDLREIRSYSAHGRDPNLALTVRLKGGVCHGYDQGQNTDIWRSFRELMFTLM